MIRSTRAVAALLAVVVTGCAAPSGGPADGRSTGRSVPTTAAVGPALDPFTTDPCGRPVDRALTAAQRLPDHVRSIRFCPAGGQVSPHVKPPEDALVTDVDATIASVRTGQACTSFGPSMDDLQVTDRAGETVLIRSHTCTLVSAGGRRLDTGDLSVAVGKGLERQRAARPGALPHEPVDTSCALRSSGFQEPPSSIAAVVVCDRKGHGRLAPPAVVRRYDALLRRGPVPESPDVPTKPCPGHPAARPALGIVTPQHDRVPAVWDRCTDVYVLSVDKQRFVLLPPLPSVTRWSLGR